MRRGAVANNNNSTTTSFKRKEKQRTSGKQNDKCFECEKKGIT